MNQDTHLYIEANQKHGHGYQVHIVIDGIIDTTMADEPFSLYDALGGAQLTLEAVNKERGTNYLLPDVLLVSREAAEAERKTDFLSAKLLRENNDGPVPDDIKALLKKIGLSASECGNTLGELFQRWGVQ